MNRALLVTNVQSKHNDDHEKTPVASSSSSAMPKSQSTSTISRLESKYSDILGRISKNKKAAEQSTSDDDRDKTLEPDKSLYGLSKSATTIMTAVGRDKYSSTKERTPYRLRGRNKYADPDPTSSLNISYDRNDREHLPSKVKLDRESTGRKNDSTSYDYSGYGRLDHYTKSPVATTKPKSNFELGLYDDDFEKPSTYRPSIYSDTNNNKSSPFNGSTGSGDSSSSSAIRRKLNAYRKSNTSSERRHTTNYRLMPIDVDSVGEG